MEYQVIYSRRRTLALEIGAKGLLVRAPYGTEASAVERFVEAHRGWIEKHLAVRNRRAAEQKEIPPLTREELTALAEEAARILPARVAHYAAQIGVSYGRITVRSQRTKWGSCSAKGNLNFNCLLLLAPPQVLDCIVVHELCHRKEMNHSPRFYREVYRVYPAYDQWNRWLKENGFRLLARLPQKEPE
ncbi:MAG: M48 family metallopeptidase [Clostridia bacterium]|nr:M48 family metallopeptidase [Clostridia bacterium]